MYMVQKEEEDEVSRLDLAAESALVGTVLLVPSSEYVRCTGFDHALHIPVIIISKSWKGKEFVA